MKTVLRTSSWIRLLYRNYFLIILNQERSTNLSGRLLLAHRDIEIRDERWRVRSSLSHGWTMRASVIGAREFWHAKETG